MNLTTRILNVALQSWKAYSRWLRTKAQYRTSSVLKFLNSEDILGINPRALEACVTTFFICLLYYITKKMMIQISLVIP